MAKIKFTKGELKKQRDSLAQFRHYLPTLQLKKQQLQMKILEARKILTGKESALKDKESDIKKWVGLLADPQQTVDLKQWVDPEEVVMETVNIAGVNVPFLKEIRFTAPDYDFYTTPFWTDRGILEMRGLISLLVEVAITKKRIARLEHELRVTTQRVNLFEKIKIPECLDNIRRIRIYLGDQQANAVGISKAAKKKLELVTA